ncbi:hypothetical protein, partial [Serratia plymuthica]|uniref:hypothetical protein n=1 Tax=Serratia plymuthica TaxID=82996 RepID=UPI001F177056
INRLTEKQHKDQKTGFFDHFQIAIISLKINIKHNYIKNTHLPWGDNTHPAPYDDFVLQQQIKIVIIFIPINIDIYSSRL